MRLYTQDEVDILLAEQHTKSVGQVVEAITKLYDAWATGLTKLDFSAKSLNQIRNQLLKTKHKKS